MCQLPIFKIAYLNTVHSCGEIWLCSCIKVELLCQLKYSYLFILVFHKLNIRKISFGSEGLNSECELEASISVSGIIWVPHSVCGNHSNSMNPVTTYLAEDSYKQLEAVQFFFRIYFRILKFPAWYLMDCMCLV